MLYTPDDYNRYDVLVTPFFLIVIIGYLIKQYILVALPFFAQLPWLGLALKPIVYWIPKEQAVDGLLLFTCLPAFLVFISLLKRTPQAGTFLRYSWYYGRYLLLSSASLEIIILISEIILKWQKINDLILLFIYLDLICIFTLVRSQRIKDVFAQFPHKNHN